MKSYNIGDVQTLLDAVLVVGAGESVRVPYAMANHSWEIKVTGEPTVCSVKLQGSLDDVNWYDLDTSATTTGELRHVANKAAKYVRGNVITLTDTVSPVATVTVRWFPAQ